MNLLQMLASKRTAREQTDREKYLALVRKAAAGGSPTQADADALEKYMAALGYDLARVEADVQTVARFRQLSRDAEDLPARREAYQAAAKAADAYDAETERIGKERKAKGEELRKAAGVALRQMDVAGSADHGRLALRKAHPGLLGDAPRAPAYLLPRRDADEIRLEFEGRRQQLEWVIPGDPKDLKRPLATPEEQRQIEAAGPEKQREAVEAFQKLAAAVPAGAVVFHVTDQAVDAWRNAGGIDLAAVELTPIPGQAPAEFEELADRLRAACPKPAEPFGI